MGIKNRLSHAWNAFRLNDEDKKYVDYGTGSSRPNHTNGKRKWSSSSLSKTVFNRIATDCSMVSLNHVKISKDGLSQENVKSGLERCLTVEANKDQNYRDFLHDLVYSMLDEGVVAVVPTETTLNPTMTGGYDVSVLRVGRITQWFPQHVRVNLYNEKRGIDEEVTLEKKLVAIIENPFYAVVNDENATLKRLIRKLELLDRRDEDIASGKFNMLIQLPYVIKGQMKREQAEERIAALEAQLSNSKYGVAYTDGTEKVTQLSRPIENDLADQIKYLQEQFYNQIGATENIFNGTAGEVETRAYYNRTIDPIIATIIAEFRRKWLTDTARTQGQEIVSHRDPFTLVPVEQLANIADTFTRNAILTSNEVRKIVGFGPSSDPLANELSNKNIAYVNQAPGDAAGGEGAIPKLLIPGGDEDNQNGPET